MPRLPEKYAGVWPVMLTPFDDEREIDFASLEQLIEWYLAAGVHGLFAACQSSEVFHLSDAEIVRLVRFVIKQVNGRVPVVASGHTADAISQQIDQLAAVAATGVDGVILISNRLATQHEQDATLRHRLAEIVAALPPDLDLGIYECPYPYKRLLDDDTVRWCAATDRFTFIKDTCCELTRIARRVGLVAGSRLNIANANSQTLLESLRAGAAGYCGVMANFHPELYVWLYDHWRQEPARATALQHYLATSALVESLDYPVCAKDYQMSIGNFVTAQCRVAETDGYFRAHEPATMRQMIALGEATKHALGIGQTQPAIG